jgi:hypothetical protein
MWLLALALAAAGFASPSYAVPVHGAGWVVIHSDPVPSAVPSDPLHGECSGCHDNGTITPTSADPLTFSFTKSPDTGTETFFLDILIPNNVAGANAEAFSITGTHTQNATVADSLVSATPWTSGKLDAYLGISASPSNPISAFLPSTDAVDPGATGYFDYSFNFGTVTFGSLTDPQFTSSFLYPAGTIILAFADIQICTKKKPIVCTDDWTATASSSAILETRGITIKKIPEPLTLSLFGAGLAGLTTLRRRKNRS